MTTPIFVSADGHVFEPADLWTSRLPEDMRDRALGYRFYGHMVDMVNAFGSYSSCERFQRPDGTYIDEYPSIDTRIEDLETDGVWSEVVYPNIGMHMFGVDHDLAMAHARIYNDFVVDLFGRHFDRFAPVASIPLTDVDDAVAEVERVARLGLRAISVPTFGPKPYYTDTYDRVWEVAQANGMPVSFHTSTGFRTDANGNPLPPVGPRVRPTGDPTAALANRAMSIAIDVPTSPMRTIASLVLGGITERFPDLHFVAAEFNAFWLAGLMGGLDKAFRLGIGQPSVYITGQYDHQRSADDQPMMFNGFGQDELWPYPLKPSEYIRRQVHATFMDDPTAIANRDITGIESLLWSSDYPHPEATWPRSMEAVDDLFAAVPDAERAAITGATTAKLYGLSMPPALAGVA